MLTPVTPNPLANATTIKSHGSETRTAAGHNPVEAQATQSTGNHSQGIGLDAGSILSNVNAEAATAGSRTILQTLALAVAAQLNIIRRDDETMEAFFLRIASALDDLAPDERAAVEIRAGLKVLKIQIPELSAALKQPDGALAARLSAAAEAPLATPQKTAAAAATTSYLQEAPGVSRAAETLAMVTQARSNDEGNALFSSTPAPSADGKQPADARSLQTQLKSLFEPGVAETRIEIATKIELPSVLILGDADEPQEPLASPAEDDRPPARSGQADIPKQPDAARQQVAAKDQTGSNGPVAQPANAVKTDVPTAEVRQVDARQADTKQPDTKQPDARPMDARAAPATKIDAPPAVLLEKAAEQPVERRPEPRMLGLLIPQNNNVPSASLHLRAIARELVQEKLQSNPTAASMLAGKDDGGDHRMQTMLTLKGIAEVITTMPSKAAEFLMSPQLVADIKAKEQKNAANPSQPAGRSDLDTDFSADAASVKSDIVARRDAVEPRHLPLQSSRTDDAPEEMRMAANRTASAEQQPSLARAAEPEKAAILKAAGGLDPVPFAYAALLPAKEEFSADAIDERPRHDDENDDAADQQAEDEETRRERLARKATDDLLRIEPEEEPDLKITRDSSQADRAYALYQRMAGF